MTNTVSYQDVIEEIKYAKGMLASLPRVIAACDIAIIAINKQIPKEPRIIEDPISRNIWRYYCPECGEYFGQRGRRSTIGFARPLYCECGQAIDWSNELQ